MNTLHPDHNVGHKIEHKVHDFVEHIKVNWAENVILAIIFIALMCLVLSSSVSYG